MKPDLTKRLLAAGLAVTLLFGASACGKKPKEETPEAQETVGMTDESKNYVYRAEPLAFSSDVQLDGMNCLQKVGDRIHAAGMTYDTVPSAKVYAFDKDGSNVKELTLPLKSNQDIGASCFDEEGSLYTIRSSYGWDVIEEEETA